MLSIIVCLFSHTPEQLYFKYKPVNGFILENINLWALIGDMEITWEFAQVKYNREIFASGHIKSSETKLGSIYCIYTYYYTIYNISSTFDGILVIVRHFVFYAHAHYS